MLDPFVFDSRSESCKKPYGAVPCGTAVSYTVRPLRREGWSRCVLVTQREFSGQTAELELPCTGQDGDRNRFSGIFFRTGGAGTGVVLVSAVPGGRQFHPP